MIWTTDDFDALGVGVTERDRVAAFGGAIENSPAGWQAYINAHPAGWRLPLITAWLLHARRIIHCPDLIWRVARIAFREQPEANAQLRVYAKTLGPDTWREARSAAVGVADDAADDDDYATYTDADAADAAALAAAAAAADVLQVSYIYAIYGVADATCTCVRPAIKAAIKAEIIAMAVEELQAVPA